LIAIGTDYNPVISYYDITNEDLNVAVDGTVLIFKSHPSQKIIFTITKLSKSK